MKNLDFKVYDLISYNDVKESKRKAVYGIICRIKHNEKNSDNQSVEWIDIDVISGNTVLSMIINEFNIHKIKLLQRN